MKHTTIGEACTLHARIGWQGLTKSEYLDEGDYYLVTGVDFDNGHIAFDSCHFVTKERYDQDQHIQLQINDVLVTKDGTIGKVAFIDKPIDKPATLNSGVFVVRPKNPDLLLPEYLMIILMSEHFGRFIEQIKVGCTIAHLNQEKFLRYQFPLPPVTEQQHIIEVYYSATEIIEKRQCQLRALDTLIKARFVEMFGDPISNSHNLATKSLSEVMTLKAGDFTAASDISQEPTETNVYPCYGGNGIRGYVAEYNQEGEYSLIGRQGALSGNVQFTKGKFKNTEHALLVTPITEMNNIWLNQLLIILDLKRYQTGAAQPGLSVKNLREIQIITAPKSEQNRFAAFVSQVDKSKAVVQAALYKAQLLFDSLMQQYFG